MEHLMTETSNLFLRQYNHFVNTLLSDTSKDVSLLIARLKDLDGKENVNIARLMTASDGIAAEGGELKEIVKKCLYQGKPLNVDNRFHILREMGDIIFYWMVACQALNITPDEVIEENIRKLEARYPGGTFNFVHSEIRKDGDL
jgi:phosphoribosyl-ATP pyrophosphohydrolase